MGSVAWRMAVATVLAATSLAGCAARGGLPPLWETETGLPGGITEERRFFGLWERSSAESGVQATTLHLLGTFERDDANGIHAEHVLPPFYLHRQTPTIEERIVAPVYFGSSYGTADQREQEQSDDDVWLFPFLAWGEEPGEGKYFMFLPFGGVLKGKLFTDEIRIYGFPLYMEADSGDVQTQLALWPLIARRRGLDRLHWRVLPFWSQTDRPGVRRRSVAWPFIHWNTVERGDRTMDGWFVFPFVGHRESTDGTSKQWTFLYPFFQFAEDEKTGDSYRGVLWPFHKKIVRPGVSESEWWWPFWGKFESEDETSSFHAWPFVWNIESRHGREIHTRNYVVPFWMRSEIGTADGPPREESLRSWPFFSWRREESGLETVRVPAPLPLAGWAAGERTYSDFLSLYRRRSDDEGRCAWDAPLGLVRYRRDETGDAALTLLWWLRIPLGGGE